MVFFNRTPSFVLNDLARSIAFESIWNPGEKRRDFLREGVVLDGVELSVEG